VVPKQEDSLKRVQAPKEDGPAEKIEPEAEHKQKMIEVWKCPECKQLNKFGDSYECGRDKCPFNLGYYDDLASCIIETTEEEFSRS